MVSLQVAPFHHPAASVLMRALGAAFGTATSFAARPWRCCRRLCRRRLRRSRLVMQQVASSQAALQTWHLQTVDERVQTKQSTICRQRLHMVALCWDKMPLTSINNVLLKHLSATGIETKFQRADDLRYARSVSYLLKWSSQKAWNGTWCWISAAKLKTLKVIKSSNDVCMFLYSPYPSLLNCPKRTTNKQVYTDLIYTYNTQCPKTSVWQWELHLRKRRLVLGSEQKPCLWILRDDFLKETGFIVSGKVSLRRSFRNCSILAAKYCWGRTVCTCLLRLHEAHHRRHKGAESKLARMLLQVSHACFMVWVRQISLSVGISNEYAGRWWSRTYFKLSSCRAVGNGQPTDWTIKQSTGRSNACTFVFGSVTRFRRNSCGDFIL